MHPNNELGIDGVRLRIYSRSQTLALEQTLLWQFGGKEQKETVKEYGADQVKRWRRSYDEPSPPMPDNHEFHPARDPRYRQARK